MRSLLITVFVVCCCLFPVGGASADPPPGGLTTKTAVDTLAEHLKGITATKTTATDAERKKELLKSVRAIEDRGLMHNEKDCDRRHKCDKWKDNPKRKRTHKRCLRRLKHCYRRAGYWQKRRIKIVVAAMKAEKATGVDAVFMIAMGRMESDFRPLQLIDAKCGQRLRFGGRRACGADCGITQHRLYGRAKYVRRMCKKYAKDFNLVFLKSAQEIASHVKYCKKNAHRRWNHPLRRCVLNRYNQGTFYKTRSRCKRSHNCGRIMLDQFVDKDTWYRVYKRCRKNYYKCLNIAAYWTKLSCFEHGARNQIKSKRSCRRCFRSSSIKKFYPTPKVPLVKPTVTPKISSR